MKKYIRDFIEIAVYVWVLFMIVLGLGILIIPSSEITEYQKGMTTILGCITFVILLIYNIKYL